MADNLTVRIAVEAEILSQGVGPSQPEVTRPWTASASVYGQPILIVSAALRSTQPIADHYV